MAAVFAVRPVMPEVPPMFSVPVFVRVLAPLSAVVTVNVPVFVAVALIARFASEPVPLMV